MAAKNEAKISFVAETSEFNNQIKLANQAMTELRSELKLSEEQFKGNENSVEALTEKKRILQQQLEASAQKVEALSNKLEKAKVYYKDNSEEIENLKNKLESAKQGYTDSEKKVEELRQALEKAEKTYGKNSDEVAKLKDELDKAEQEYTDNGRKVDNLNKKLDTAEDTYVKNKNAISKLQSQLNNAERQYVQTENAIEDCNRDLDDSTDEAQEAEEALDDLSDSASKASDGFTVMKGVIADLVADGIRLLVDGLKDASKYMLNTGMDFEAGMSQVQATSGSTAEEMELLTAEAMRVGEVTKFSAAEAAEGLNYMAMAGWKSEDMLAGLEGMANLAAAANTDLGTASDIVTDTLTAMGYAAGDSAKLADVMAAASSNANTNVELMGYTFKYAAPVAGALGYSMEDLAVATGLMANAGIKGEQAGTTLRAGLTNLVSPASTAAKAMEQYGISVKNSDGTVKPLSETMETLRQKLGQLPEAEQAAAASAIFGKEAMSGWLSVINSSDEDFAKLTSAIYNSEGAAQEMATTMQDNLKGDVEELGGAIDTLAIKIYDGFSGSLREGVQAIHGFITGSISMSEMFAKLGQAVSSIGETIKGYMPTLISMGKELVVNLANGLVSGIPTLVTNAANMVTSIATGIANNAQKILEMGGKLVVGLGESIVAAVPKLIISAANIVKSLASGITGNAQTFVSKGLDLLNGFADSLTRSVPALVKNGMEFIRNLVKGLMNSLPELISRVPEIVSKFANVINDNAPTIIAGGVGIIKDLIVGIIKAIPTLVKNIPKIITAIVDVWEAFNWLSLGKKAITLLKNGIVAAVNLVKSAGKNVLTAITNVLKNLPQNLLNLGKQGVQGLANGIKAYVNFVITATKTIWTGIINVVKYLPSKMLDIGKNLVKGLWNGISNMTGWVINKIKGFGESVLGGIKKFFGIKSPSTVLRDQVGRFLAEGVGVGIEENEDAAIEPMQGIVDKIKGIDVAGEWGKLSGVGGSLNYDVSAQLGDYVSSAIDSNSPYALLGSLIDAVEDLASRPIRIAIGDRDVAEATASASDNVSGNRLNLRNRGLAL